MRDDLALLSVDELRAEIERLRAGLTAVHMKWKRASDYWHPRNGKGQWGQGFHTGLAECSLIATAVLDPEGTAVHDELMATAAGGTDREWLEATGHCGHCGEAPEDCLCTDDDPCHCGPHEIRNWPKPCSWCKGSGQLDPPHTAPPAPAGRGDGEGTGR